MTDEYKERIIKWLTNNYTIEPQPQNVEAFYEVLNNTTTTLNTYFDTVQGYIQGRDGKGNQLDMGFIYGEKNNKGIIAIVDKDFNILQVIDEYNTGTKFNIFTCLNIDITNGNIYGIDHNGSTYRFLLLNNFMVKTPTQSDYEVKLRNDYFITLTQTPRFVEKRPSDSFYIITGLKNDKPAVATYKIEVGSTNELVEYSYTTGSTQYSLEAYNIAWSGENFTEKICCYYTITNVYDDLEVHYTEFAFTGTSISKTYDILLEDTTLTESMLSGYITIEATNLDTYICYPLNTNYDETLNVPILQIDYDNESFITVHQIECDDTLDYSYGRGRLIKANNQIFYYLTCNTDSPQDNTTAKYKIDIGVVSSNGIVSKVFEDLQLYSLVMYTNVFSVSQTYNLATYNLIGSNSTILLNVNQVFNDDNYNWQDYQYTDSLVPHSAILYSNNKIVFARNLYNKTINGNITMASVEIPNMLLNDISITPQQLLGVNNGILIENSSSITKNIYEDLFINFYNTLTMQNQNTATYITNLTGATRLNSSISQIMDYNNAKISKIRIHYSDDTTFIKTINPATRISQFVYQFKFNVYVPSGKTITSIELISNDEDTVYQTIGNLSLASSKSYDITQNVEIGE